MTEAAGVAAETYDGSSVPRTGPQTWEYGPVDRDPTATRDADPPLPPGAVTHEEQAPGGARVGLDARRLPPHWPGGCARSARCPTCRTPRTCTATTTPSPTSP